VVDSSLVPGGNLGYRFWNAPEQPRLDGTQIPRRSPLRVTTYLRRCEVYCEFYEGDLWEARP
jgi:hypothetical protein